VLVAGTPTDILYISIRFYSDSTLFMMLLCIIEKRNKVVFVMLKAKNEAKYDAFMLISLKARVLDLSPPR